MKSASSNALLLVVLSFFLFLPSSATCKDVSRAIDPQADKVLRQMGQYLRGLNHFIIKAQTSYESILDSGQKLTYLNQISIYLKRPNGLYVHRKGMIRDQDIYYDGKTLTLYGRNKRLYATAPVPPTIDEMLDYAVDVLHLTAPGSDLLYSDVYKGLMSDALAGMYVGKNMVNGVMCHHLAYRGSEVDWQLWVEAGNRPVPRKYIITSKWITGAPEFSVTIFEFDPKTPIADSRFIFSPQKDAKKVPFLTPEQLQKLRKKIKEYKK